MPMSSVDISLPEVGRCLRIENATDVVTALTQAMPGWPVTVDAAHSTTPDLYMYRDAEGLWQGSLNEPNEFTVPSAASAACSLVGELVSQRLQAHTELLGLHCASVEIDGQLVVFPESSKAGKSTLSVAFAAAGYRVFGDDALGLSAQGEGVAMGVAPRLRLPLPESFSAEFVAYSERHAGPQDERYRFVIPTAGRLASYQDRCPIGTIVLLERDPSNLQPQVVTLAPGEGLLQLLQQNFASSDVSDARLLKRLLPLVQQVNCVLLRYSEPLVGARYLAQALQQGAVEQASPASLLHTPPAHADVPALSLLNSIWTPALQVSVYTVGDELFLIHTSTGAIHRLNVSGKLAWQLLHHEPLSGDAISAVLAEYFAMPVERVQTDIAMLLAALVQAGLVVADA